MVRRMNENDLDHRGALLGAILLASDRSLQMGFAPRPQVHLFHGPSAEAYSGYVECRPYYRGDDATEAIAQLLLIASGLDSTDLLVVWEESDLRRSMTNIEHGHPSGIAILHATASDTTLHWNPFQFGSPLSPLGLPRSPIVWGVSQTYPVKPTLGGHSVRTLPREIRTNMEFFDRAVHMWRGGAPLGPGMSEADVIRMAGDAGFVFHLVRQVASGQ